MVILINKERKMKMKKINAILDFLKTRLFSSTYQLQRVVVLVAILLVLALVSFGTYYYYDRYSTNQPTVKELSLEAAEKAVRDDPQNVDKRLKLAETYMSYARFDDAISQAVQIKQSFPDNLGADFVLGVSYANNGNPTQAIDPLNRFINSRKGEEMAALDQSLQSALYYLGDCYLQLGRPKDAVQPLEITVNFVHTDADSVYKLGLAYAGVQRYDDAIQAFRKATAFVPNFSEAYVAMSQVYTAQKMTTEAEYAQAMVSFSKKDYVTANQKLTAVVKDKPTFAPAFTGLGMTCEAQGNLQCALNSYKAATALTPDDMTASQGVQRVQLALNK
jgi:tetratricopeptide (TPR) repeat protein